MPIIFHNLGPDVPEPVDDSQYWQVAYYDNLPFPTGLAWVTVDETGKQATVEHIIVNDERRRQGIATALVEACQKRWPGVYLDIATNPAGLALIRRFQAPLRPEDVFTPEAIAKFISDGMTREQIEELAQSTQERFDALPPQPPMDDGDVT
jgi:GNAT superfamily N-acetyltransferase